jgi:hypothetical protein
MLLKILPFAACGVLYLLWRLAAYKRDQAKAEAESYKASYELAGETQEIKEKEKVDVEKIEKLDLNGVVDALRGIVRDVSKS